MSKLKNILNEMSYEGNLGFEEMVSFYKKASRAQQSQMETALENNDWNLFKKLVKDVIGVNLK